MSVRTERLATFSSPLVRLGDFNFHVDDIFDSHGAELLNVFASHDLRQHINSPTHVRGHTLDLLVIRNDQNVVSMLVDPLVDHSLIVAQLECKPPVSSTPSNRRVRAWRSFNVDEFISDLQQSQLVTSLPVDVTAAFACYEDTISTLLDKHAPYVTVRAQRRSSARWYDSECRSIKRETRQLERLYRRHRSPEARSAWKNQFVLQRRTFQRKFSEFWLNTVESQRTNPRGLWRVVNDILKPPLEVQTKKLSVDDLASHLHNKIAGISRSTANAPPPTISPRSAPPLTVFDPVTEQEVAVLQIQIQIQNKNL